MPVQHDLRAPQSLRRGSSSTSLRELRSVLVRRRWLVLSVVGGLLFLCLLYCLIAPNPSPVTQKRPYVITSKPAIENDLRL